METIPLDVDRWHDNPELLIMVQFRASMINAAFNAEANDAILGAEEELPSAESIGELNLDAEAICNTLVKISGVAYDVEEMDYKPVEATGFMNFDYIFIPNSGDYKSTVIAVQEEASEGEEAKKHYFLPEDVNRLQTPKVRSVLDKISLLNRDAVNSLNHPGNWARSNEHRQRQIDLIEERVRDEMSRLGILDQLADVEFANGFLSHLRQNDPSKLEVKTLSKGKDLVVVENVFFGTNLFTERPEMLELVDKIKPTGIYLIAKGHSNSDVYRHYIVPLEELAALDLIFEDEQV